MTRDTRQIGGCAFWHLLSDYDRERFGGSLEDKAEGLADYFYQKRDYRFNSPDLTQIKGMAVELCVAFSHYGKPMTPRLIELLTDLMALPPEFGNDLQDFYSGRYGKKNKWSPEAFNLAQWYEADYVKKHGKRPKATTVAHKVGVSEETVRKQWRKMPEYQEFIEFMSSR